MGQRQPRLLLGHRRPAGLLVREQPGHLVLIPPVDPPRQQPARRLAPQQPQQLRGTTGADPERGGNAASTKMQPNIWPGRAAVMTGMNNPALLCATSMIGWFWPGASRPARTASTTRGQNGGPPSPTCSGDGTRRASQARSGGGRPAPSARPNRGAVDQDKARRHGGHPSRAGPPAATETLTLLAWQPLP
jgi:hypothetical protein